MSISYSFNVSGSFKNTEKFLEKMAKDDLYSNLDQYGKAGVAALASATPKDSGLAASSWTYKIVKMRGGFSITWLNRNVESGFPVAIMLQYGHGTGTGGWVAGRDYINPAMRPIFDQIVDNIWKVVTSA